MEATRKPARKPRGAVAASPAAKKKSATAARSSTGKSAGRGDRAAFAQPTPVAREDLVRTAAYFRAERRGFAPGYEWEDWLAAEAEVGAVAVVAPEPGPKPRKAPARKPRSG